MDIIPERELTHVNIVAKITIHLNIKSTCQVI